MQCWHSLVAMTCAVRGAYRRIVLASRLDAISHPIQAFD